MSAAHFRWRNVSMNSIVDAIYETAHKCGQCHVFLSGCTLRIEEQFDAAHATGNVGTFKPDTKRHVIESQLLGGFLHAVAE